MGMEPVTTSTKLEIGSVIERSIGLVFGNGMQVLAMVALVTSPVLVYRAAVLAGVFHPPWLLGQGFDVVLLGLAVVLGNLGAAACVHMVMARLRGEPVTIGTSLASAVVRLPTVVGVAIVVGLTTAVGMMLCLLPGLLVMTMMWVAIPAAVVENRGVFDAIQRSVELTEGNRLRIFLLALLLFAVFQGSAFAAGLFLGSTFGTQALKAAHLLDLVVSIVQGSFNAVLYSLVYHDLRRIREGLDVEDLVAVFE